MVLGRANLVAIPFVPVLAPKHKRVLRLSTAHRDGDQRDWVQRSIVLLPRATSGPTPLGHGVRSWGYGDYVPRNPGTLPAQLAGQSGYSASLSSTSNAC